MLYYHVFVVCISRNTQTHLISPIQCEPSESDIAEYREWCAMVDARDEDARDARREMEYQDSLDAGL